MVVIYRLNEAIKEMLNCFALHLYDVGGGQFEEYHYWTGDEPKNWLFSLEYGGIFQVVTHKALPSSWLHSRSIYLCTVQSRNT